MGQFLYGFCPPLDHFFSFVVEKYRVAPTQFLPNSILFLTTFYLICKWMGVELTVQRFQSCFTLKNGQLWQFLLNPRSVDKQLECLRGVNKTYPFDPCYVFIRPIPPTSFCFTPDWSEDLHPQGRSSKLGLDHRIVALNALFKHGRFDIVGMYSCVPLLAY